ncbi:MAG: glycosyl transferase, partial [Gemmatimonadetes bacterium]|nr:glycosyl transferase [Gemmatimonadota bacterium]
CRLSIDDASWSIRLIAAGANLRSRVLALPYGDQGLLITRAQLDAVGGYEDIPLMEDVALALRLRRDNPIRLLRDVPIHVSARRWRRDGPWRRTARNLLLLARYLAGADPRRLARAYRAAVTS